MQSVQKYSVGIAGTTERTVRCAEALRLDERFAISWALTPAPRVIGRKQLLTKNPVQNWAELHKIKTLLIESKIDTSTRAELETQDRPDFLLVVDFGYWIPSWLLALPTCKPLNVHPSELPRWRGSSPGQFVLLHGETTSAVCVIEMSEGMDEGPIVHSLPFAVDPRWTQAEYYTESFSLIAPLLPELLSALATRELTALPQPARSPTPVAKRLSKTDSFVEWSAVLAAMQGEDAVLSSPVLSEARAAHASLAELLAHATRAFSPWPLLWSEVNTRHGKKRLQLLSADIAKTGRLQLCTVKLEGKHISSWDEVQEKLT
jgi:methionyl-tRNA formyltransferase